MLILKSLLFLVSIVFIIYRFGVIIEKLIGKLKLENIFIYGVLLLFAVSQLVLTPCALLHTAFNNCIIAMVTVIILLLIISFVLPTKTKKEKINIWEYIKRKNKETSTSDKIITCIMICLIAFQTITTAVLFRENADDSYYVSLTTSSIDSESVYMEEPSMGYKNEEHTLLLPTEQIPTYELEIAVFSKIFDISPPIIYHTLLPIIFIIISYMTYYYFARSFMNAKDAKIFIIFLSVIFMFTGFTTKYRTGCLLCKMWQGKAIFINIVLNMILASLIRMNKKVRKTDVVILTLANLSAIHLTSTAIFLVTFIYLAFGIFKLINKKIKDILYLCITFLPILVYVLLLLLLMRTHFTEVVLPQHPVTMLDTINTYGNRMYLIYYLISVIIIAILGNKEAKKYFVIIQLINLLTIWNPLFSNLIARYLTSSDTFWRVLWLLPLETTIAYAITIIIQKAKNIQLKIPIIIISFIIIVIPGKFVYTTGITENLEKIPQYIIDQTNYILEKESEEEEIVVLAPPTDALHGSTMRQLSSKIKLIYSRNFYLDKIDNKEIVEERKKLVEACYSETHTIPVEEFNTLLEKNKVQWIIVSSEDKDAIEYVDKSIMSRDTEIGGYTLYTINELTK